MTPEHPGEHPDEQPGERPPQQHQPEHQQHQPEHQQHQPEHPPEHPATGHRPGARGRLGRRVRRAPRAWAAGATIVLAAVIAAAVYVALPSGGPDGAATFPTHTVAIYVSLPLEGPERAEGEALLKGFQAGVAAKVAANGGTGHQIGNYRIRVFHRDDATPRGWSPLLVRQNALEAAHDPSTVLYIGELDSAATAISLPILNQAGVAQITPGSGYVGLTQAVNGVTESLQPGLFYPTRDHTLLRLIPDDMVQAGAILQTARQYLGCQHVAALSRGSAVDGPALVKGVRQLAHDYGMTFVPTKFGKTASRAAIESYAASLKTLGVGCFVLAGLRTRQTLRLVAAIRTELPHVPIIGSSGLCRSSFTDVRAGGVPPRVAGGEVYCVSPTLPLSEMAKMPGSDIKEFVQDYRRYFPDAGKPSPYAVNGFVAAEMAVEAITALGEGLDRRLSVRGSLFQGEVESLPLGVIAFDRFGNSSLLVYGLYRVGTTGAADFVRVVDVSGAT